MVVCFSSCHASFKGPRATTFLWASHTHARTHARSPVELKPRSFVSCRLTRRYLRSCGRDGHQQELESTINEALDWLDETPDAELEDLEDKKKEVEQIANPIMKDLYQQAPQGGAEEDFDFGDDEL